MCKDENKYINFNSLLSEIFPIYNRQQYAHQKVVFLVDFFISH